MSEATTLPQETKEVLTDILVQASKSEHKVVEFRTENGELTALDVTEHFEKMEEQL